MGLAFDRVSELSFKVCGLRLIQCGCHGLSSVIVTPPALLMEARRKRDFSLAIG
jgi:hypothetical protein